MAINSRAIAAGAVFAAITLATTIALSVWRAASPTGGDPATEGADALRIGARLYEEHCASCHGADLEGQKDWRTPLPDGGFPAPPHDETGHTWHHSDEVLFTYTRDGGEAVAGPGFQSNMPGFADVLSDDEIRAVIAFIKASWPEEIRNRQARLNPNNETSPR